MSVKKEKVNDFIDMKNKRVPSGEVLVDKEFSKEIKEKYVKENLNESK